MIHSQVLAHVKLQAVVRNYQSLLVLAPRPIPVVKADAYGHGLLPTAEVLLQAGARRLAVGSVEEAVFLREAFGDCMVVSLLGPVDAADAKQCRVHRIMPFVFRLGQLRLLHEAAAAGEEPLPVCLKFDTGMGRLGFAESELLAVLEALPGLPSIQPVMVASHLATADEPQSVEFTLEQGACLKRLAATFSGAGYGLEACLANSAAILALPELRFDAQRPGLSLYGLNPLAGTAWEDKGAFLEPAMSVSAPVLQVHDLDAGRPVSYGRLYTAPTKRRTAIVAAGYADLYSRGLSSADGLGAAMVVNGRRAPVLGRVCMQMTAVDVTDIPEVVPGQRAWLLGGPDPAAVSAQELADWWGTNTYEVATVLGMNERRYE